MGSVKITQTLEQTGDASYLVKLEVDKGVDMEVIEFRYDRCNQVFPAYRSLINILPDYEDVHIELQTDSEALVREYNDLPNKNARLLQILKETLERQGITLDATLI